MSQQTDDRDHPVAERRDKEILLSVGDGPEGIEIYASEDEGVVDWSNTFPAVYLVASINGASIKLGPFQLPAIYQYFRPLGGHPHALCRTRNRGDEGDEMNKTDAEQREPVPISQLNEYEAF